MSPAPTWREAWNDALYGTFGFFRREAPADHFRTSAHASPAFASAVIAFADTHGLRTIVDLGSGRGELLNAVEAQRPGEFALIGVELGVRPAQLADRIDWVSQLPEAFDGLLIANEYLDNVPCDVVEADDEGTVRVVHIDPATGDESLGSPYDDRWLAEWWPELAPGERAEVGSARDDAWADAVSRVRRGVAVAVDYGHRVDERPPYGSVRSYADGHEVDVCLDGSRDVTAHVAVDAVAARVGATLHRQRDILAGLGVDGTRPPLALATSDPHGYVEALAHASGAAELVARGGLGDFWWIVTECG